MELELEAEGNHFFLMFFNNVDKVGNKLLLGAQIGSALLEVELLIRFETRLEDVNL